MIFIVRHESRAREINDKFMVRKVCATTCVVSDVCCSYAAVGVYTLLGQTVNHNSLIERQTESGGELAFGHSIKRGLHVLSHTRIQSEHTYSTDACCGCGRSGKKGA